jgi:hypothetical protein
VVNLFPLPAGIHRAERLICCFFEERNHQKAISRLGEKDFGICHTEKLLLLNSYALSVGCPENRLPYQVATPRKHTNAEAEYMGFAHKSEIEVMEVSNPTNCISNDINEEPRAHREQDELLSDLLGEDLDIEVFATEEEYNAFLNRDTRATDEVHRLDEMESSAGRNDRDNHYAIEQELKRLLPIGTGQETTIEAFKRLTNQCAWIPFRNPNSVTFATEIDKAEAALYDEWMSNPDICYNPLLQSGPRTFKAFERDWNNEVTRRFRLWSREGDEGVVQLRYKTKLLLQQYYNQLAENASLRAQLPQDEDHRRTLDEQLRNNRQHLTPAPLAADTSPPTYSGEGTTPIGCPTALNTEVTVGAVRRAPNNPSIAPFHVVVRQVPTTAPPRPSRKRFRSRKYCVTCGFKRSEHIVLDEGVAATCDRTYCGKCRQRKDCHGNCGFGLTCTKPTHPWQTSHVADWYDTVT